MGLPSQRLSCFEGALPLRTWHIRIEHQQVGITLPTPSTPLKDSHLPSRPAWPRRPLLNSHHAGLAEGEVARCKKGRKPIMNRTIARGLVKPMLPSENSPAPIHDPLPCPRITLNHVIKRATNSSFVGSDPVIMHDPSVSRTATRA